MTPVIQRLAVVVALAIAAASDIFSLLFAFAYPVAIAVDVLTAILLFAVLGRRWLLAPALLAEAIPGLAVFPFWFLAVMSIVMLPPPTSAGKTRIAREEPPDQKYSQGDRGAPESRL